MRKHVFIALTAFFCLAVSANAATLTVTKTADTNDGVCDSDCSLREAIAVSLSGDSIVFASPLFDTQQRITLANQLYVSSKTLTITGRGSLTEISGNDSTRIFQTDGTLTLNDMHLISGRTGTTGNPSNGYGGGILNNGTLTVNRCQILFCTTAGGVTGYGGAIHNIVGKYATINQSYLGFNSLNSSAGYGAAISNEGGLVLMNSVVGSNAGNSPFGNRGVGVYNNPSGTMEIIGSTIFSNTANRTDSLQNLGGGIFNEGLVVMSNSTVSSNSVRLASFGSTTGRGGGIYNTSGSNRLRMTNCTVAQNFAENSGSGIWSDSSIMLANTIVSENSGPINAIIPFGSSINSSYTSSTGSGLLPLAENGGPTPTYALSLSSPARNAGSNCSLTDNGCGTNHPALSTDQRGNAFPRRTGTNVDIGSFEYTPFVTNSNSSGAGSLSQLIADATPGDTILFETAFFSTPRTITGLFSINKNLTIVGPGADLLTIDGNNSGRLLSVTGGATVDLSGIRFTRGRVVPPDASGAGIVVFSASTLNASNIVVDNCSAPNADGGGFFVDGTLNLIDSTVENNSASGSAGIYVEFDRTATLTRTTVRNNTATGSSGGMGNNGTLNFYNSTLSGNTAPLGGGMGNGGFANFANSTSSGKPATSNKGGGIYNNTDATVHLLNTTVTNNQADGFAAAGIWNENSTPTTVRARNTIIAGNISGNGNPIDFTGGLTNLGNNLINNANPGLAPLGNYGGPTATHALLQSSPALNAGDNCVLTANTCGVAHDAYGLDQRGSNALRLIGANVDIGSFERNISFTPATLPSSIQNYTYNQQVTSTRLSGFADGNLAPFTYSVISGSLPPGLALNTSTGAITGSLTQTGAFPFTIKVVDTDGIAGVQAYSIQVFGPTSANVTISGRVLTTEGISLRNATVHLTDSEGRVRTSRSSSFGYYRFEDVEAGRTYVIAVNSKRFTFTPRILTVTEELSNVDLIAQNSPELLR